MSTGTALTRLRTTLTVATLTAAFLVCGCRAPFEESAGQEQLDVQDWSPHHVPMEWWYVSAFSPDSQLAFHAVFFRVYATEERRMFGLPVRALMAGPGHVAHLSITDLKRGRRVFRERRAVIGLGCPASAPPLRVGFRGWSLCEDMCDGSYRLHMGEVDVRLEPLKPAIVHPPGHSGTEATGRLAYQSIPRLSVRGCVAGKRFEGMAWMDHQWGDQMPASTATWDWCGLHDEEQDADIMLYQVHDRTGRIAQTFGTITAADGTVRALQGLRVEALRTWESATGRQYRVALRATADDFLLETTPLRLEQEICSKTAELAYWEGPVRFAGQWQGRPLKGHGMAECVHGPRRAHGAKRE